jgi:regulator of cell morphogenesis and NO signaling
MLDPRQTVASLVLDHPECASVFQRHRIDYCCRGDMAIATACEKLALSTDVVLSELRGAIDNRDPIGAATDVRALSMPALVAHIVQRHHAYLRTALPFVNGLAEKVARVHGDRDVRLSDVAAMVRQLSDLLLPHLDDEENVLFPRLLATPVDLAVARRELIDMRDEHLAVGALLERIRRATDDFLRPEWACNSYRTLLAELENLETDVLVHVHLENHELMPRFMGDEPAGHS